MGVKIKRSEWGDLKSLRFGDAYRGSPVTLSVLAGITAIGVLWACIQSAPVVAQELTSASTSKTITSLVSAQRKAFIATGVYASDMKELGKYSRGKMVEWPVMADIQATCQLGYLLAIHLPGDTTVYRSSESSVVGPIDKLTLPSCITVDMLDDKTQIPSVVDNLTIVRSVQTGGPLSEAALISWSDSSSSCTSKQKPTYEVRALNKYKYGPVYQTFTTQDLSLEVPNIWNGSDYTFSVRAQCNDTDRYGESTDIDFSQTLPAPNTMSAMWSWNSHGTLGISWNKVSSSPWVSYETFFNEGNGAQSLIPSIREGGITLYPKNYSYGSGDTFSVRAISDAGAPTESAFTKIEKAL